MAQNMAQQKKIRWFLVAQKTAQPPVVFVAQNTAQQKNPGGFDGPE